jgi:hypothetical protein
MAPSQMPLPHLWSLQAKFLELLNTDKELDLQ